MLFELEEAENGKNDCNFSLAYRNEKPTCRHVFYAISAEKTPFLSFFLRGRGRKGAIFSMEGKEGAIFKSKGRQGAAPS